MLVLFVANFLTTTGIAEAQAMDLKGLRILVCAGYFDLLNIPAVQKLKATGAEVRVGNLSELNWDTAKQYHVIIAVDENAPKIMADAEGPAQVLQKFATAGGGIFFFCNFISSRDDANYYLKPLGAELLRDLVEDSQHSFKSPAGFNLSYAYTGNITTDHPVTEGVKGIWYNAQLDIFHTSAIEVSNDWKILVSGETSSTSASVRGLNEGHIRKAGKIQNAPPILAAREFGAGSIVLTGISPIEAFFGQGLPVYLDIVMKKGDGIRPSDFGRLYENALYWMAKRAGLAKDLGQGKLKAIENVWEKPILTDWGKEVFGGQQCSKPAKGVIGLHSTLSDGKATPESLIAKAKASGLQWVAFTEKFEILAKGEWIKKKIPAGIPASAGERSEAVFPDKWEQLRRICKEASTDEFYAMPGLDYPSNNGDRYVVFGDFNWPPEKVFSPDKTKIIDPQWWFNIGSVPNGPYNTGTNHLHPWDYSLYNMWPIRTTIAGRQTDDSLSAFGYVQGNHDDPFPMAIDMVYDENDLVAATERMCNFIMLDKPGNLTEFYKRYAYLGSSMGFVSDGPLVTDWRCHNATRVSGGKWYLPSTERYRVKLSVRSEEAVTDIKIYDGPWLFRRFCPGKTDITVIFDVPHDKQRNLFAVITDAKGRIAATGGHFIRDFANWRFMCSDRGNSICDGVQVDSAGAYLTGPTAPYQRKMTAFGVVAGYGTRHFNVLPPHFDGGMRPIGMNIIPQFQTPSFTLPPPNSTLETKSEISVCSRDGLLQEDTITGYFPGHADAWSPKLVPFDVKDVKINYRYLNITPRAGDPGVILLEGKIRFEKATKLESMAIFSIFHSSKPGEGNQFHIETPGQTMDGISGPTPFSITSEMIPGSYVSVFPSFWGSTGAMAIDNGYIANVSAVFPNVHVGVSVGNMPRKMKAGEELNYRLLLMHGRPNEVANTADWENFSKTMGLRGNPSYEVKDVKVGQVTGKRFILELEPVDAGFVGTITGANLPCRLPIRVANMNPNWTFAYFDLDRKEWFPSAVDQVLGKGYFTLDTRLGNHRIFAGHPVIANNPELRILVLSDAKTKITVSVNNVADTAMDAVLRLNPALGANKPVKVHLNPGEVKDMEFNLGI